MDANNNNRLQLNFGNANERLSPIDRTYPTTPSTFPQPVFPPPGQAAQQPYAGGIQPQQPAYGAGYPPQTYFSQNQYPAQYSNQQHNDYAHAQNAVGQARSNTPGANDPNTSLAQQFSHQNLAGGARGQYNARGPSPSPRPRTAGSSGQSYNSYVHAPMPTQPPAPVAEFQQAPERNPDRYGSNANSNQKKCSQLAADFFKDSVKRARERNQR